MKYIVYPLLLILASCGPEAERFDRQYVIENSAGVPIELQFYRRGELAFRFGKTPLQNGERLEGLVKHRSGGPWSDLSQENNLRLPSNSFEADSIRIIYDNLKLSTFAYRSSPNGAIFTPTDRNILRDTDYTSIGGDKFLFTISESDFENAGDCNGNCE